MVVRTELYDAAYTSLTTCNILAVLLYTLCTKIVISVSYTHLTLPTNREV